MYIYNSRSLLHMLPRRVQATRIGYFGGGFVYFKSLGEAEIGELDIEVTTRRPRRTHDVLRFEVAVDYICDMAQIIGRQVSYSQGGLRSQ